MASNIITAAAHGIQDAGPLMRKTMHAGNDIVAMVPRPCMLEKLQQCNTCDVPHSSDLIHTLCHRTRDLALQTLKFTKAAKSELGRFTDDFSKNIFSGGLSVARLVVSLAMPAYAVVVPCSLVTGLLISEPSPRYYVVVVRHLQLWSLVLKF
nr:putative DEAD-box ATP-dependent RNA helicase 29 isoform X1 [Ipomoea trifida]